MTSTSVTLSCDDAATATRMIILRLPGPRRVEPEVAVSGDTATPHGRWPSASYCPEISRGITTVSPFKISSVETAGDPDEFRTKHLPNEVLQLHRDGRTQEDVADFKVFASKG
jgi:hypothetical protein